MLSRRVTRALVAVAALAATGVGATPAVAGEYDVSVCRHADGSVAPVDGWRFASRDDFANVSAFESCGFGGQVNLDLRDGSPHGTFADGIYGPASVSFSASPPAGTAWRRLSVWWAYRSSPLGAATGPEQVAGSVGGAPAATCAWGSLAVSACSGRGDFASPLSAANLTSLTIGAAESAGPIAITVTCSKTPDPCPSVTPNPYAQLRAFRLLATLEESSPPAFTGPPVLPETYAGTSMPVAISATDAGSGVRTAQLVVDGRPIGAPRDVGGGDGRCVQHSDGSFGLMVPCPLSLVSAPVALDAAGIANGSRSVAVRIADAAGNSVDSAPRSVTIDNPVPLPAIPVENLLRGQGHIHNGSGSAPGGTLTAGLRPARRGAAGSRPSMRVRYGRRARLAGRLVGSDGKPVSGALLSVTATRSGFAPRVYTVRTRSGGTYSRDFAWGPSRRIVVAWYPWSDSITPVRSRGARLLGVARVTLSVSPARPRNGRPLILTGRVVGARSGTRVAVQVRAGRFWRTFLVPAVDRRGRYRGRRTLTSSSGVSYCLRALVLAQPNFAYVVGHSRVVCRRVR